MLLDTDIGTDVDDAWALVFALACENIDLKAITLVHADLEVRALITLKILKLADKEDIPVYKGLSKTLTGDGWYWWGHEGTETDFSDIDPSKALPSGVDAIIGFSEEYQNEGAIASIGPMTNIAAALQKQPGIADSLKILGIMGSTFIGLGIENAGKEHNAAVDSKATKIVFESKIPKLLVGYNVTVQTAINETHIENMKSKCPLADYLLAMTKQYMSVTGRDFCYMHDGLAIASLVDPEILETTNLTPVVLPDGRVSWHEPKEGDIAFPVAINVNINRFNELFLGTIFNYFERIK